LLSTVHNLNRKSDNRVTTKGCHVENTNKRTADVIPSETLYAAHF